MPGLLFECGEREKVVIRKAQKRTAQQGGQGDVIIRVGEKAEKSAHIFDLPALEVSLLFGDQVRNAGFDKSGFQRFDVLLVPVQHPDVTVFDRPVVAEGFVEYRQPVAEPLVDDRSDAFGFLPAQLFCLVSCLYRFEQSKRTVFRHHGLAVQRRGFVLVEIQPVQQIAQHRRGKDRVDLIENDLAGAPAPVEGDRGHGKIILQKFCCPAEHAVVCAAERVDRLLGVADQEGGRHQSALVGKALA